MTNPLSKLASLIKSHGVVGAVEIVIQKASERRLERKFDINTSKTVELADLGILNPECKHYGPTEYRDFKLLMMRIHKSAYNGAFLDYGAGMGRAMVLAAEFPFKRILGVEISNELAAIASNNFSATQKKAKLRCQDIQIIVTDATDFKIPEDVTVIYLNNPFFGSVLNKVLMNIRNFKEATRSPLAIICNMPGKSSFENQIEGESWLGTPDKFLLPSGRKCTIYTRE
jgi:hypothetical protein